MIAALLLAAHAGGPVLTSALPTGVPGEVADLAVAPDGSLWLAAAAWQSGARVWTGDGAFRAELMTSDQRPTTALATSPDGRLWVGFEGGVHAYPADLGAPPATGGLPDAPRALAFLPDGDALVALDAGGLVRLDGASLAPKLALAPGVRAVRLAVDPSGRYAVACESSAVHLVKVQGGKVLRTLALDEGACVGVGWAADGDAQAMTSRGHLLRLDARGRTGPAHEAGEPLLSWDRAPGGPAWAVTATGEVVRVADDALFTDRVTGLDEALAVRLSADGGTAVIALRGGGVAAISARDGEPKAEPRCVHGGPMSALTASTALSWSVGADGDLLAWHPDDRCEELLDLREPLVAVAASGDGARVFAAAPRALHLLDVSGAPLAARPVDLGLDTTSPGIWTAVAMSPDGRVAAAAGTGTGLVVHGAGAPPMRHRLDHDAVALAVRPDGEAVGVLLADGTLRVVDAARPAVALWAARAPEPAPGAPCRLRFLPDGRVALSVGSRLLLATPGLPDTAHLVPPPPGDGAPWLWLDVGPTWVRAANAAGEVVTWSLPDGRELSRTAKLPTRITTIDAHPGALHLGNPDGVRLSVELPAPP